MCKALFTLAAGICLLALSADYAQSQTPPSLLGPGWQALDAPSAKLYAMHSFSADVSTTEYASKNQFTPHFELVHKVGFVQCLKPNYARLELWTVPAGHATVTMDPGTVHEIYLSDGLTIWSTQRDGKLRGQPATADGSNISGLYEEAMNDFFQPGAFKLGMSYAWPFSGMQTSVAPAKWKDTNCLAISWIETPSSQDGLCVFINQDGVIRGIAGGHGYEIDITNIRANARLSPSDFVFHKPAFAPIWSKIDPQAEVILRQAANAYSHVDALAASMVQKAMWPNAEMPFDKPSEVDSNVRIMRPNYWAIETSPSATGQSTSVDRANYTLDDCDGAVDWNYWDPKNKHYDQMPAPGQNRPGPWSSSSGLLDPFFSPNGAGLYAGSDAIESLTFAGTVRWHGEPYREIQWTYSPSEQVTSNSRTYFIGADDLIHRILTRVVQVGGAVEVTDSYLTDIDWHPALAKSDFAFTPPPGATEQQKTFVSSKSPPPVKNPLPIKGALLANGTPAPDFTVRDRLGNAIHLSDYKGKVVILDCWATWCASCQPAQPYTNAVGRRFRGKDVVVLGIAVWDSVDAFKTWLPLHNDYDAIKFAIDPAYDTVGSLYNISAIPAQFVIGRDGRIVWSHIDYEPGDVSRDPLGKAVQKALAQPLTQ